MKTLSAVKGGLGHANLTQQAVRVSDFDWEDFEIILPEITFETVKEKDEELLNGKSKDYYRRNPDEWDDVVQAFGNSDAYHEWKDSFSPMMLFYWPLCMYGMDATKVATLIDEFAPVCTLVEINGDDLRETVGEDHALVLTGGGMDLSDHLAIAYLCAESIPPVRLLSSIPGVIVENKLKRVGPRLRQAYREARASLMEDANRMAEDAKRVFGKAKKKG